MEYLKARFLAYSGTFWLFICCELNWVYFFWILTFSVQNFDFVFQFSSMSWITELNAVHFKLSSTTMVITLPPFPASSPTPAWRGAPPLRRRTAAGRRGRREGGRRSLDDKIKLSFFVLLFKKRENIGNKKRQINILIRRCIDALLENVDWSEKNAHREFSDWFRSFLPRN